MASLHPRPMPEHIHSKPDACSDEGSGQDENVKINPKLIIEEIIKELGDPGTCQFSPVEQVFVGVLPTYYPPSSPILNVYYTCEDCGDTFAFESSLTLHTTRITVTIEYHCAECSKELIFYNRCSFLSHLRQHNFDPSKRDFGAVKFSMLAPPLGVANEADLIDCSGEASSNKCRSDDEQNSNCSSSSSGFASECRSVSSADVAPPTSIVSPPGFVWSPPICLVAPPTKPKCLECQVHLSVSLCEHYRGDNRPTNPRLDCSQCGLLLPTRCCLSAHQRVHSFQRPYVCPECCAVFSAWLPFWSHISKVCYHLDRVVRHACQICHALFSVTSSLHKHISLHHTGHDLYVCKHCNNNYFCTEFPDKEKLRHHLDQAHNIKHLKPLGLRSEPSKCCQLCGATVLKRKYIDHVFRHCNASRCYAYECPKCKEVIVRKDEYVQHINTSCLPSKTLETEVTESSMLEVPPTPQSKILGSKGLFTKHSSNTDLNSMKNNTDNVKEKHTDPQLVVSTYDSSGRMQLKLANKHTNGSVSSDTCMNTKAVLSKKCAPVKYNSFHCKACNDNVDMSNNSLKKHLTMNHKNSKNIVFEPVLQKVKSDLQMAPSLERSRENHDANAETKRSPIRSPSKRKSRPRFTQNRRKADVMETDPDDDDDDYDPHTKESGHSKRKHMSSRRKLKACSVSPTTKDTSHRRIWNETRQAISSDDDAMTNDNVKPRARKQFKSKIAQNTGMPFSCPNCAFSGESVEAFKEHIIGHRSPNDFQCMECGMCFVTKPSFNIHLIMSHKIKDVEVYLTNNDCCNMEVVEKEVTTPVLSVREEEIPTVLGEHQCSICRKVCDSALNLSNHFRTHGMAYLLWKKKQGHAAET